MGCLLVLVAASTKRTKRKVGERACMGEKGGGLGGACDGDVAGVASGLLLSGTALTWSLATLAPFSSKHG
jgi:hypothetical protein